MRHLVEGCVTQERGESLFLSNPTPFARLEVPARVTRNETNACGAGRWIAVAPMGQAPRVRFIRGDVPHLVKDTGLRREVGARRHVDTVERAEGARSGTIRRIRPDLQIVEIVDHACGAGQGVVPHAVSASVDVRNSRSVARGGPDMDVTHEGSEAILNGYCPRPVRVSSSARTTNPESVVLVLELPEDAGEGEELQGARTWLEANTDYVNAWLEGTGLTVGG